MSHSLATAGLDKLLIRSPRWAGMALADVASRRTVQFEDTAHAGQSRIGSQQSQSANAILQQPVPDQPPRDSQSRIPCLLRRLIHECRSRSTDTLSGLWRRDLSAVKVRCESQN